MENCKYCNQELDQGSTLCPHCGKDNAAQPVTEPVEETVQTAETTEASETAEAPKKKATPGKIALAVAAVIVLVAALIALIAAGMNNVGNAPAEEPTATAAAEETAPAGTIPADGNPADATCKGSYTVTDEEARTAKDTVVATIGDAQMTNGDLQVHYWSAVTSFLNSQQGQYVTMYGGMDFTQPLDTQVCVLDTGKTWQQHFLQQALTSWQISYALAQEAQKAGVDMSPEEREFLDGMGEYLETTAASFGLDVPELLKRNIGPGAGLEEFVAFQELYSQGGNYYAQETAKLVPTQEELREFYDAHAEEYAQGGLTEDSTFVDVRHILVFPEGGTEDESGNTTYSQEEWDACRDKAQAILDSWLAGDKTEESFAALANEKSEDPGSNTKGGLYEKVTLGQMVEPFENWCFDASRKPGDYGLVQTSYGYHVMYFVNSTPQWEYFAKNDWTTDQIIKLNEELAAQYPMEADYSKMVLGFLDLAQ